jgi:hypothetical protein
MKLEVGKKYVTRKGSIVGPMIATDNADAKFFAEDSGLYFEDGTFGYGEYCRCENFDIVAELVDETPDSDTTSADAFARIIASLNDAVNAMLASDDCDKAIEYAIMMRECERMRDE